MRLGVLVDGDQVAAVDLDTGEPVDGLTAAEVRWTAGGGVVASITWRVVGSAGPARPETPEALAEAGPATLGREAFLAPLGPREAGRDDDDRPRPRRAL